MAKVEYTNHQNPRCEQQRFACVMNRGGRCQVLHDTHFKRACPFYKTKAMLREQKGEKHDESKTVVDSHRAD